MIQGFEGKESIEFLEFIGLKEQEHVQGSILIAVGNSINITNARNTINKP